MENKKVSVILPVYNSEKFISSTIDSVLSQTYKNFELIIVNDGSTDNSGKICEEFSYNDERIKYFLKENSGVSDTRNFALKKASGEYIAFIDSDDEIVPNFISSLVEEYNNNVELVICGYNSLLKNKIKKFVSKKKIITDNFELLIPTLQNKMLFNQVWNKLYLLNIIKKHNIKFDYSIDLGEDFKFNIDYLKYVKKVSVIDKCLYIYKISNDGLGFKYRKNSAIIKLALLEHLENFYELKKYSKKNIYNSYIKQYMSHFSNIVNYKNKTSFKNKIREIKKFINTRKYSDKLKEMIKYGSFKQKLIALILFFRGSILYYFYGNLALKYDKFKKKKLYL